MIPSVVPKDGRSVVGPDVEVVRALAELVRAYALLPSGDPVAKVVQSSIEDLVFPVIRFGRVDVE